MSEKHIQNSILHYLNTIPDCFAFELYNQAKYSPKLKMFLPTNKKFRPKGLPDVIGFYKTRVFGIETKTLKGRVSPDQKAMHLRLAKHDCPVFVCRSLDDAIKAVETMARSLSN